MINDCNGSYIYFNKEREVIQVNTLTVGVTDGLNFGVPYKWEHKFDKKLVKQDRFHCITIFELRKCGAKYFCWLFPSKFFLFFYIFHFFIILVFCENFLKYKILIGLCFCMKNLIVKMVKVL